VSGTTPTTLHAVQRAALERAIADSTTAPDHLALVGAVEAARPPADDDLPLPVLTLVPVLEQFRRTDDDPDLTVPDAFPTDDRRRLRVRGAVAAVTRLDVDPERAAGLAAVPLAELRTALHRTDATDA
jgi:hypothetical protein